MEALRRSGRRGVLMIVGRRRAPGVTARFSAYRRPAAPQERPQIRDHAGRTPLAPLASIASPIDRWTSG